MQLFQTGKETLTQPKILQLLSRESKKRLSLHKISQFARLILPSLAVDGEGWSD